MAQLASDHLHASPAEASALVDGPKRSGRRTVLRGVGLALAAIVVVGGVIAAVSGKAIMSQYPAALKTSDTVAGLTRASDSGMDSAMRELATKADDQFAASGALTTFYAPAGDLNHAVLLFGVTRFVPFPQSAADGALSNSLFTAKDVRQIEPGPLGGYVRCGAITFTKQPAAACVWADHGSVGTAVFVNRPVAESAVLFRQIREAVLTR